MERPRPGIRRKSSASNLLLATLKPGTSGGASTGGNSVPSSTTSPTTTAASTSSFNPSTISSSTTIVKDWDNQSIFSESSEGRNVGSAISPTGQNIPTQPAGSASADLLRDMVAKRMKTFGFLKSVHEGKGHWLQSIQLSRQELDKEFDNVKMRKRTHRFHVLGLSLSSLWDISAPNDFLRALLTILDEFDRFQDDVNYKPKMRNLFKGGSSRQLRKGSASEVSNPPYADFFLDGSILLTPPFPFPLDYSQTLYTLYDILLETYHKMYRFLGPSVLPSSHAPISMRSASNPLPNNRSRAYSTPSEDGLPSVPGGGGMIALLSPVPVDTESFSESLGIPLSAGSPIEATFRTPQPRQGSIPSSSGAYPAYPTSTGPSGMGLPYGPGLPPMPESPPPFSPQMADQITRIDAKIKKIWQPIVKELDAMAREIIKQELAMLSLGGAGLMGGLGGIGMERGGSGNGSGSGSGSGAGMLGLGFNLGGGANISDTWVDLEAHA
ncbi:hypothetical protein CALCODRAFT_487107 [Calocera cornea HHB12733]|uniref:Uncharacterized protein n=1 Tax=Calocera cornea HHB12733 TaxID=1353952 RepID=A0A165DBJ3_9BASI|nr:hypothetical protein CALCODRAFT_487107 [Calocera cornea HHB12733]